MVARLGGALPACPAGVSLPMVSLRSAKLRHAGHVLAPVGMRGSRAFASACRPRCALLCRSPPVLRCARACRAHLPSLRHAGLAVPSLGMPASVPRALPACSPSRRFRPARFVRSPLQRGAGCVLGRGSAVVPRVDGDRTLSRCQRRGLRTGQTLSVDRFPRRPRASRPRGRMGEGRPPGCAVGRWRTPPPPGMPAFSGEPLSVPGVISGPHRCARSIAVRQGVVHDG